MAGRWLPRPGDSVSLGRRGWTVVAGVGFGAVALATSVPFAARMAVDGRALAGYATVGGIVTGGASWWLLVGRRDRPTVSRGVVAGALAGALAHGVVWLLWLVSMIAATGDAPASAAALWELLLTFGVLLFFSVLVVGWITVPAGMAAGAILVALCRARSADTG